MPITYNIDRQLMGAHMEALVAQLEESFFFLDSQYNFLYVNPATEKLLLKSRDDLLGKNIWEVINIENNPNLFNIIMRSIEGEKHIKTNVFSNTHQKWLYIEIFKSASGISVELSDVRRDRFAFENVKQLPLETLIDNIPQIAFAASVTGTNIYFNKKWAEYTGELWEGEISKVWKTVIHPDDYERVIDLWYQHSSKDEPYEAEYRIKNYNGEYRWHLGRSNPVKAADNTIDFWIGTVTDINELKETQQKLKASKRFTQTLIDNSPDIIIITDYINNKNTYSNKVIGQVLGYDEKILELPASEYFEKYVHPEDLPKINRLIESMRADTSDDNIHNLIIRVKDGHEKWHWLQTKAMIFSRTESGVVADILFYYTDVTSIKETELKLKESIRFTDKIAEASPDLITILDFPTLRFTYVNRAPAYSFFPVDKLINSSIDILQAVVDPHDWPRFREYFAGFENAADEDILHLDYQMINTQKQWRWARSRGKIFERDENGKPAKIIIITQDITASKEIEEAARQNLLMQQLLEKKDEFMSVASHELKTPITTMKASIQILERLINTQAEEKLLKVFITKANEQINRLTSLINALLDNAKIQADKLTLTVSRFHIGEVIEESIMHSPSTHVISLKNIVSEPVEGDKNRIGQVLTNFITNAIKYSPNADKILIDTTKEGEFLKVCVRDFGIGIPKEKIDKVFDRFFRVEKTSSEFSGLGLGLYISEEIIKRHNGEVGVSSEEGKGSTFWFKIPMKFKELPTTD
jgi:two-component system CheB/CheR fusion protein